MRGLSALCPGGNPEPPFELAFPGKAVSQMKYAVLGFHKMFIGRGRNKDSLIR